MKMRIRNTCLAALMLLGAGCTSVPMAQTPAPQRSAFEDNLGVKVEGLRLSAAGYLLDLRYRVVDAEKARVFTDRKTRPVLEDPMSGMKVTVPDVPKAGQLRTTGARALKPGRTYSILFANPGRTFQPGAPVTLVAGDVRLEGLRVQ